MRFALIESERLEASPGLRGVCPGCGSPVISHCGKQRVWHWKHSQKSNCARWSEPETEWHRHWKDLFPREWQEVRHCDEATGEIHIADVCTASGAIIEFQHSHLRPDERDAREKFYKNLVWVVDGTRLKRDFARFLKGMKGIQRLGQLPHYLLDFPEECFPEDWIANRVPVVFDFKAFSVETSSEPRRNALWCLWPSRVGGRALLVEISTDSLVRHLSDHAQFPFQELLDAYTDKMYRHATPHTLTTIRLPPLKRRGRF